MVISINPTTTMVAEPISLIQSFFQCFRWESQASCWLCLSSTSSPSGFGMCSVRRAATGKVAKRKLPGTSRFCRSFPPVSGHVPLFPSGFNRSYAISHHFLRFNRPLQPLGLQHEDSTVPCRLVNRLVRCLIACPSSRSNLREIYRVASG